MDLLDVGTFGSADRCQVNNISICIKLVSRSKHVMIHGPIPEADMNH